MNRSRALLSAVTLVVSLAAAAAQAQPAAPSNLTAQAVRSDRINLLFQDNATNETSFDLEGRPASSPTFALIGSFGPNITTVAATGLAPGTNYFFRVRAVNAAGNSAYSNVASDATLSSDSPCVETATAMCLNSGRFRVQAMFLTLQGQSGEANTVRLTSDSGYLWFFASANIEAVVKVLNGCAVNQRYWVFAGGLTNVRVMMSVTDTTVSSTTTYINPLGVPFQPIQDTGAFATCP
jgi:hypothetical protein